MNLPSHELRCFLKCIDEQGELCRVKVAVDPYLEIAAITDRASKAGGPALCFDRPTGFTTPVLTNLFGTPQRAAWALGSAEIEPRADTLRALLAPGHGPAAARLQRLCAAVPALNTAPAWRELQSNLDALPALHAWPGDGGRYLTLPLVVTRDPESGQVNWGMYRVQLLDSSSALIAWKPGSGAARHHAAWRARGMAMPVSIVLGAPPALLWAAGAQLPVTVDEAACVGLLTGSPLGMTSCESCNLPVPAAAEAVIEGTVATDEVLSEGPFGNHTGAYVPATAAPVFRLTVMHQRREMFYPCTVVGPPPMEDCYLARLTERLLLALVQCDLPQVVELSMPLEGIFHGCALVAVRGDEPAIELCARLRQTELLRASRMIVLFDETTDVHHSSAAFWLALNRVRPERDLRVGAGCLDIDARRVPPAPLKEDPAIRVLLARRCREYGLPEQWFS